MANSATVIILVAGSASFGAKWYQTKQVDWKVPVATLFLAAGFDVLAKYDSKAATMLALIVLLGALTTTYNGKSAIDIVGGLAPGKAKKTPKTGARK